MAARTVTCPECGKTVPYGRLSCPECGSLLASVVGSDRRATPALAQFDASVVPARAAEPAAPPLPAWPVEPPPLPPAPAATTWASERPRAPGPTAWPTEQPMTPPAHAAAPPPSTPVAPERPAPARRTPTPRPAAKPANGASAVLPAVPAPSAAVVPAPAPVAPTAPIATPAAATPRPATRTPRTAAPPPSRRTAGATSAAEVLGAAMPVAPTAPAAAVVAPAVPTAPAAARTATPRRAPRADVPFPDALTPPAAPRTRRPSLTPAVAQSVEPAAMPAVERVGAPSWPDPHQAAITPRATPRPTERARTPRKPTNGAASHPMPAVVDGPPIPTWPPVPAGEPLPPSAAFAGAPDAEIEVDDEPVRNSLVRGSVAVSAAPRPPSATRPSMSPREMLAPLLEQLQIELPDNLADWLIAAGSAIAAVGFLLPWSDAVVGAKGFGGYTDSWGLASPSHVFVLLAVCGMLTLAVMPNPIPAWIRSGFSGVLAGGLLVGLVWPYLIGGMGAGLGVMAETMGAILLLVGGFAAYRDARHGDPSHSV